MKRYLSFLLLIIMVFSVFCVSHAEEETVIADTLEYGDKGTAVLELQTRLRALYYYTGPLSGEFGAITRSAVAAVQAAYGLEQTGRADPDTLSVIYGECYRPLQYNSQGDDVKLLQERLTELGYYHGQISGNYLDGTKAAISTFQGEFGLTVTGKADVETQQILYANIVRPAPSPTPDPTPIPTVGPYLSFPGTLKYGSTGANVQKVQQRLMDLGFFTFYKTTQGYYSNTQKAVEAFQSYNGLEVTGTVNEKTWNALFNDETVVPADGIPKPTPEPEPVPYSVEVDVNNQVTKIWAYNAATKEYDILYKCFLCSTGTKSNPSDLGTFILSGRRARWCEFPKWGGGKAQYWVKINESIAFHSLLYAENNEMSLRVSSYNALGSRASHGCIRLTVADAKWVYDNCGEGTVVVIHEDGVKDPELVAAIQPGPLDKSVMLPVTTPAPTQAPAYDGTKIPEGEIRQLSNGKSGEDVYWLQMKLKELGFYKGTVTGTYLDGTKAAVKAYQKANKIYADGVAGKQTLTFLYNQVIEENATPEPTAEPTVEPTPAPTAITVQPEQTEPAEPTQAPSEPEEEQHFPESPDDVGSLGE